LGGESKKVLAVSSGGGHWVQLNRLAPALAGHRTAVVTVDALYRSDLSIDAERFYVVNDATRWNKLKLVLLALRLLRIQLVWRPDVVLSTGAAPGYLALRFGKLFGARTIWIDSIANVERLSLSGQRVGRYADLWLTQWPHLAAEGGPDYAGSVLCSS
jgi:UDP-N-acetylglucosamine:LPS N-acetylglucosamine transferase